MTRSCENAPIYSELFAYILKTMRTGDSTGAGASTVRRYFPFSTRSGIARPDALIQLCRQFTQNAGRDPIDRSLGKCRASSLPEPGRSTGNRTYRQADFSGSSGLLPECLRFGRKQQLDTVAEIPLCYGNRHSSREMDCPMQSNSS
jgi:hypothetical protein